MRRFLAACALSACAASTPSSQRRAEPAADRPPAARTQDVVDDYFGTKVEDPYRWMERGGDELTAYLTAQGKHTAAQLGRLPGRDKLLARLRGLSLGGSSVTSGVLAGDYRFYTKIAPNQQMARLAVGGPGGAERILVDPERMPPERGHVSIDNYQPTFDGRLVAVNLAEGGGEVSTVRIYESATGRELPDVVERIWGEFAISWLPDGKSFFYTQMAPEGSGGDRMQGMRALLHVVGRPTGEDKVVLAPGKDQTFPFEPTEFPQVYVQPGTTWMVGTAGGAHNEVRIYVAPLAELRGRATPWRKVAGYDDGVESYAIVGDDLALLAKASAPNGRVVRVPLARPDVAGAKALVPEDPDAAIEGMYVSRDALYLVDLSSGKARLRRLARGAALPETLTLPYDGWISSVTTDPLQDGAYVPLAAWTRPMRIFRYLPGRGFEDTGLGQTSPADMSGIAAVDVAVRADDGEMIPLTILARKDLARDGSHPTIVYAYGGYGYSTTPRFDGGLLAWLERGGVYAFAHVRGGGEKGDRWHLAGKGRNKPRGVKDFHACAEYLARERYTTTARLAATGGSMGGVLIGRAITERPDLFSSAVIEVGMLNVLRYLEGTNGANQTSELGGTPATVDGFRTLWAMDAYHNIHAGTAYPGVLLVLGLNDGRVPTWNSAKFGARMQIASTSGRPVLLRVDADAGHGVGSTRDQLVSARADAWSFVLWQAGDPEFQPGLR